MRSLLAALIAIAGMAAYAPTANAQATTQTTETTTTPAATPAPADAPAERRSISNGLLFIEPGVTYTLGSDTEGEVPGFDNTSGKANGPGLMGRLGFHIREIFVAGLDARYSWVDFEDSGLGGSADATAFNWGPFVGVQMPNLGLRVWGNYIVGGNLNPDEIGSGVSGIDVKLKDAEGYRLGAGFRVWSVSLNLEYQELKYDSEKEGGIFSGNYDNIDLKDKAWIASVSFPFEL